MNNTQKLLSNQANKIEQLIKLTTKTETHLYDLKEQLKEKEIRDTKKIYKIENKVDDLEQKFTNTLIKLSFIAGAIGAISGTLSKFLIPL
jgi:uncharacterized protein Yka (UPF0111/DUF47 family)